MVISGRESIFPTILLCCLTFFFNLMHASPFVNTVKLSYTSTHSTVCGNSHTENSRKEERGSPSGGDLCPEVRLQETGFPPQTQRLLPWFGRWSLQTSRQTPIRCWGWEQGPQEQVNAWGKRALQPRSGSSCNSRLLSLSQPLQALSRHRPQGQSSLRPSPDAQC